MLIKKLANKGFKIISCNKQMVLIYLFFFLLFWLAPLDTDLGWHLRNGQTFLTKGKILTHNEYTYYLKGSYFTNPTLFYEIILALVFRLAGFWGLTFLASFLLTLTFWLFLKINPQLPKIGFLGSLLVIFAGWLVFFLGIRSQLLTVTFLVLLFYLLLKKEIKQLMFILPLLFFFWVNSHGGFFLGLFVLLTAVVCFGFWQKVSPFYFLLASLFSFLATLLNPYGLAVYDWPIKHLKTPMSTLIAEWVALPLGVQLIVFFVFVFLFNLFLTSQNKEKFFWLVNLSFFTLLAFLAKRNLVFFGLTAVLAFLRLFQDQLFVWEKKKNWQAPFLLFLTTGILLIFLVLVPKNFQIITDWSVYCAAGPSRYPCAAVEFIKKNPPAGVNVFNTYEWGGFLEWQLPDYQYFVDGRMPAWSTPEGKSPYSVYLDIIQAQPGYQVILDKYQTDWLLIGRGTFLDLALTKDDLIWQKIYEDELAVIYERKK